MRISNTCSPCKLQIRYGSEWGMEFGTHYPGYYHIEIDTDEAITEVRVNIHDHGHWDKFQFITNKQRNITSLGAEEVKSWGHVATGKRLLYISGRAAYAIDQIQFHWML